MPTIFSHPAVPLALAPWLRHCPRSLVIVAAIATAAPDLDVAAFVLGIPYVHPLGHRGLTHSLLFAALFSALLAVAYRRFVRDDVPLRLAFPLLFVAVASHGLLDALTDGGEGIGFFIPFTDERYFFPAQPIRVSPLAAGAFLERARPVLVSELIWVWMPAALVAAAGLLWRRRNAD